MSYFPALSNPLLKEFPHLTDTARAVGHEHIPDLTGHFALCVCRDAVDRGCGAPIKSTSSASKPHVSRNWRKKYPKDFYRQGFNISAIQEIEPAQGAGRK